MELVIGKVDREVVENLKYTLKTAVETTPFWREKFSGIDVESLKPEDLAELTDRVFIEPRDLHRMEEVWPDYIRRPGIFYAVMRTSGTTGRPKRIPYTRDDKIRGARQIEGWTREYLDKGDRMASFLPQLPSSSGIYLFGAFDTLNVKSAYYQVPISFIHDRNMLLRELEDIKPTALLCLTTTAYNLGLLLPDSIKKDIQTIGVGGETLTPELADAILDLFENAVIIDNYASTEDAMTGYRVIERGKTTPFQFKESILVLKDYEDNYEQYKRIYITKVMREGELTGLPLFNYNIGDLARVENGKVRNIIRTKDVISLAGAKLHVDQVMEIVYNHPDLVDFVIIYHPLSPENPRPKAIIRVAYKERKPAGIEDEIRERIYEANNPVRYEVEESKQAELVIEAVPFEKLREGLTTKPGKTKRIYIVGKDL